MDALELSDKFKEEIEQYAISVEIFEASKKGPMNNRAPEKP